MILKARLSLFFAVAAITCSVFSGSATAQTINTFAGTGTSSSTGDGGQATAATLAGPMGVATDGSGNVYICDWTSNRVRKVNSSGVITAFAGTGTASYSGDGGQATAATFGSVSALCTDASGNVYMSDRTYCVVRKVNTSGIISTYAGTGSAGFTGDGGPAVRAQLNNPLSIVMDASGNLYISDGRNQRIRKVNSSGIISTYAGTGTTGFSGDGGQATAARFTNPYGIGLDAGDNLLIADASNRRIRRVNASTGVISTIAGTGGASSAGDGGPATACYFNQPAYVIGDAAGNIYVTEYAGTNRIRMINTSGVINAFAGSVSSTGFSGDGGPATAALLNWPQGMAIGSGYFYVGDYQNHRVRRISTCTMPIADTISGPTQVCTGTPITLTTSGGGGVWGTRSAGIASVSASGTVTGVSAGTTTISYLVSNACGSAIATYVVTVITTPAVVPIAGPTTVCQGTTITLTDAAAGGTWTTTNGGIASVAGSTGVVYGIGVGTATISYTITNPCGSSFAVVTMNVITTPVLSPITGPDTVCLLSTGVMSDTAAGGTWSSSNSALATISSTGIVTGMTAGAVATIKYSKTNVCGTSRVTKVIGIKKFGACTAGVEEVENNSEISIFPNPNTGAFTLTLPGVKTDVSVSVYDVYGRSVSDRVLTANAAGQQVSYDNLARGTYFVRVIADGGLTTHKVVVW